LKKQTAYAFLVIVLTWWLSHLFSIGWGLPNTASFAPNSVSLHPDSDARDSMSIDTFKYPPLQYLIWEIIAPPYGHPPYPKGDVMVESSFSKDEELRMNSRRLWRFRLTVAVMTLGTTILVYLICADILALPRRLSVAAAVAFILNPISLYHSHTTNMDQPYLFWFTLSVFVLVRFSMRYNDEPEMLWLGHGLFGVFIACAICTKDQVYSLYALPIAIWMCRLWLYRKPRLVAVGAMFSLAAAWAVTAGIIFHAAGGFEVLDYHVKWITNQGSKEYAQFKTGPISRLLLALKSIGDLAIALDWPTLAALLVIIVRAMRRRMAMDARVIRLAVGFVIVFASFHFFFLQVIRYSHPRFHLPFVPMALILLAYSLHRMSGVASRWPRIWVITYMIMVTTIAAQTIFSLVGDSRVQLRRSLAGRIDSLHGPTTIAVDGSIFGKRYIMAEGRFEPVRAVRDWSKNTFGVLSKNQSSIMITPLYLALANPRIVVLKDRSQAKVDLLTDKGYEFWYVVRPIPHRLLSLFSHESPVFSVFRQSGADAVGISVDEVALPFEDQLRILRASLTETDGDRQLAIFGQVCDDFRIPAQRLAGFDPSFFKMLSLAYSMNDRTASAEAAKKFFERLQE